MRTSERERKERERGGDHLGVRGVALGVAEFLCRAEQRTDRMRVE